MHDGVADAVYNGLIHFGVLADKGELCPFVQLFAHIPDDSVHFLEGSGHRHHAQGHGNVLQFIGKLAQLPGGLCKAVQRQALQIGRSGDHGLGNDDFSHHGGQLVQLAQVDADQAFFGMLGCGRGGRCAACGSTGLGRRRSSRFLRGGRRCLRLFFRSRSRGGQVAALIRLYKARGSNGLYRMLPGLFGLEPQEETFFHDLFRGGGIGLHVGGLESEFRFRAEIPDGVDQHKCPQVFHAAALIENNMQLMRKARRR